MSSFSSHAQIKSRGLMCYTVEHMQTEDSVHSSSLRTVAHSHLHKLEWHCTALLAGESGPPPGGSH